MPRKALELAGRRFARLTAIKRIGRDANRQYLWQCKCECGAVKTVTATALSLGKTKSCGCLVKLNGSYEHHPRSEAKARQVFWSKVDKSGDCWIWKTYRKLEHPKFVFQGKRWRASRLAYFWEHGEIPEHLDACHKCDNPLCVRPSHLFLGTDSDNQQDAKRKGRRAPKYGEFSGAARLTNADVAEIRQTYKPRNGSSKALAARFGVTVQTIKSVAHRRSWKHL